MSPSEISLFKILHPSYIHHIYLAPTLPFNLSLCIICCMQVLVFLREQVYYSILYNKIPFKLGAHVSMIIITTTTTITAVEFTDIPYITYEVCL